MFSKSDIVKIVGNKYSDKDISIFMRFINNDKTLLESKSFPFFFKRNLKAFKKLFLLKLNG